MSNNMTKEASVRSQGIIFLCSPEEINRERKAYFEALSKNVEIILCDPGISSIEQEVQKAESRNVKIILILYPDPHISDIPENILNIKIPTACFQIDTYDGTKNRIKQCMLFDYAFVFHPGYDKILEKKGHPNAVLIPHAVEAHLYPEFNNKRRIEVGWIGRLDGSFYKERKQKVKAINERFLTNDIYRFYDQKELIEIYTNSKIAVNISRDDYLMDANLRCFEILASGALLITMVPTELTSLGFTNGKHFVGYNDLNDLLVKIEYYLSHEEERVKIAYAGYLLVHSNHTYYHRAETLLKVVKEGQGALMAPVRRWEITKIKEAYFEYNTQRRKLKKSIRYGVQIIRAKYYKTFWVLLNIFKVMAINMKLYLK